jgi:hypothetical protein
MSMCFFFLPMDSLSPIGQFNIRWMERLLIDIIARSAATDKDSIRIQLKDGPIFKEEIIVGKLLDLTDRYIMVGMGKTIERPVFLDWIDSIEIL